MRTNRWLALALALQLVVLAVVYWPRHPEAKGGKLLEGLDPGAAAALEIYDNNGKSVRLEKKDGRWQVRLADGGFYPAESGKVDRIIEKLAGLGTARLVSVSAAAHRRLEVAEDHYSRRVKISAGGKDFTLYLGSSPGYKRIHVRRGKDDAVYLVRDLAAWELATAASAWWKSAYLDYDAGKLTALAVENGHGSFRLVRKDGKWQAGGGRTIDQDKAANLARDLCRLTITDVVTEKGFAPKGKPVATLSIEGAAGRKELSVWEPGKKNGDYTVKLADSDRYARAARYALGRLLDARLEDLAAAENKAAGGGEKKAGDKKK